MCSHHTIGHHRHILWGHRQYGTSTERPLCLHGPVGTSKDQHNADLQTCKTSHTCCTCSITRKNIFFMLYEEMERGEARKMIKCWVHHTNKKLKLYGEFYHLCSKLETDQHNFFQQFRMLEKTFFELSDCLHLQHQNTKFRRAVSSDESQQFV